MVERFAQQPGRTLELWRNPWNLPQGSWRRCVRKDSQALRVCTHSRLTVSPTTVAPVPSPSLPFRLDPIQCDCLGRFEARGTASGGVR